MHSDRMRTPGALAVMLLLPPVVLFGLAHFLPGVLREDAVAIPTMGILAAAGLVAVSISEWHRSVRIGVGIAYALGSLAALPLLGLLAVCSTGDCL